MINVLEVGEYGLPLSTGNPVDGKAFLPFPANHGGHVTLEIFGDLLPSIKPLSCIRSQLSFPFEGSMPSKTWKNQFVPIDTNENPDIRCPRRKNNGIPLKQNMFLHAIGEFTPRLFGTPEVPQADNINHNQ